MFFSLNLSIQLFFQLLIEKKNTFWIHLENLTDNLEQTVYVPANGIVMSHQLNILKKKKKQTKRNKNYKTTNEARERGEPNQVNCFLLLSKTLKNGISFSSFRMSRWPIWTKLFTDLQWKLSCVQDMRRKDRCLPWWLYWRMEITSVQ